MIPDRRSVMLATTHHVAPMEFETRMNGVSRHLPRRRWLGSCNPRCRCRQPADGRPEQTPHKTCSADRKERGSCKTPSPFSVAPLQDPSFRSAAPCVVKQRWPKSQQAKVSAFGPSCKPLLRPVDETSSWSPTPSWASFWGSGRPFSRAFWTTR